MSLGRIYFLGDANSDLIKIGHTMGSITARRKQIEAGQVQSLRLHLLAAVHGTKSNEAELHKYFASIRNEGNATEFFRANDNLIHYINWMRQQWWVYLNEDDPVIEHFPSYLEWMPTEQRRIPFDEDDPSELIPVHRSYSGPLAGTRWNRFCTPTQQGEDFYTPEEIVDAARKAMGGIDLDAASHWIANRKFKIPNYFHFHRSAFEHKWSGRVWLNPPYGNNAPWFDCIERYWDSGDITQLCIISPVWVFTTKIAEPLMKRSSAMILLTPTPSFWGHPKGNTGTNHPHAVVYLGPNPQAFNDAFVGFGHPFTLAPRT